MNNPQTVRFAASPDHALVTRYLLDVVEAASGIVNRTLDLGKPTPVGGEITANVNMQPVQPFGLYKCVAFAEANGVVSDPSPASETWERVPGKPGQPVMG